MRRTITPYAVPTLVERGRQSANIPQMSPPYERQMREQKKNIKKEHDTKSPKVEENPPMEGDIYGDLMDSNESPYNL